MISGGRQLARDLAPNGPVKRLASERLLPPSASEQAGVDRASRVRNVVGLGRAPAWPMRPFS